MRMYLAGFGVAAALQATFAWPQSDAHAGHQMATTQPIPALAAAPAPVGAYRSAFADYLRFDPDAPLKPWREANDEVRDAGGGHLMMDGKMMMKDAPAGAKAMDHGKMDGKR